MLDDILLLRTNVSFKQELARPEVCLSWQDLRAQGAREAPGQVALERAAGFSPASAPHAAQEASQPAGHAAGSGTEPSDPDPAAGSGTPAKVPGAAAALAGAAAAAQADVPAFFGAHRVFMAPPPAAPVPGGRPTSVGVLPMWECAGAVTSMH